MGKVGDDAISNSSATSLDLMCEADYAPSPNTCSQALTRANQLRVQALLRQLLMTGANNQQELHKQKLDTLRLLRKTIRELEYQLSWLTQVDFFESIERILREENEIEPGNWRLINDSTQLLIESIPRFAYEVDIQTISQIFVNIVQNLGHQRSEVRRSSLLLINMYLNERPGHFQQFLKIFIDYGLANHRNQQAQRGAILSLPLLMSAQVVEGEDLLPLIKCLSELLVDSNAQLFYSLYLALQRLHMTVGDQQFTNYLRQCNPEASLLYKQAASRNNSIAPVNPDQTLRQQNQRHQAIADSSTQVQSSCKFSHDQSQHQHRNQSSSSSRRESHCSKPSLIGNQESSRSQEPTDGEYSEPKQVTFEGDQEVGLSSDKQRETIQHSSPDDTSNGSFVPDDTEDEELELPNDQQQDLVFSEAAAAAAAEEVEEERGSEQVAAAAATTTTIEEKNSQISIDSSNSTGDRRHQVIKKQLSSSSKFSAESTPSVSSTTSSRAHLVNPSHYMSKAALCGRPMSNYDIIHHVDHSSTGLAINDLGTCCSPTFEIGPAAENELKFGIFPRQLVNAAFNSRYTDRIEALQEMMCIIRDSPINHLAILMTYFDSFLEQFLTRLMESGTDYKVELIAIDMIETIVIKTKISTMQYVRPIIGLLMKTIGDSRALFRDNTIRVIHKMMAFVPPQHVIDAIFEHKHNKNALIREESVNRVTAAVLEYDKNEFNLTKLCYHVLPMLADNNANVRLASLECIATLANALGQERIGSLLTAAEAVQTGCDYDGLLDAIHARLLRKTLPRCNLDGSIRYVIKPFLNLANANYHQEHQAADVCWVLEAPSSHQHNNNNSNIDGNNNLHNNIESPLPEQLHLRLHHAHPQHRPGVYSPPDLSQRRASIAISGQLKEISHSHQHHHHHHQHTSGGGGGGGGAHNKKQTNTQPSQQEEEEFVTPEKNGGRRINVSPTNIAAPSDGGQQFVGSKSGQTGRRASRDVSNASHQTTKERRASLNVNLRNEHPSAQLISNRSETNDSSGKIKSQSDEDNKYDDDLNTSTLNREASRELRLSPKMGRQSVVKTKNEYELKSGQLRRSNSQDSLSSTDTNKVLFKYYLGKFKQSLMDTTNGIRHPVLPSDSIIYTDSLQAYALSRHQSRQQQTSFDYDSDSVGKIPDATTKSKQSKSKRHISLSQSNSLNQIEPDNNQLSSGSESPLTVMENSYSREQRNQNQIERRQSKQASSKENRDERGGQEVEEGDSEEKQQRRSVERRKSVSSRHQHPSTSNDSRSGGATDEGKSSRRLSVVQQQQQQQQEAEESSDIPNRGEGADTHSEDQNSRTNQQRQKANLVRQSASAVATDEADIEASRCELARRHSIKQLELNGEEEQPVSSSRPVYDGHPQRDTTQGRDVDNCIVRQESTSTIDSQKSQQHSDSATQTVDNGDRQSRRRRSRKLSKKRESSREGEHLVNQQAQQHSIVDSNSLVQQTAADIPGSSDRNQQQQNQSPHTEQDNEEFEVRKRASRSQPPVPHQLNRTLSRGHLREERANFLDSRRAVSVSPSVAATNINIRHVLENVAPIEGPFQEPQLAFKVAMDALEGPCWSTKVEGILALIRLVTFHQPVFLAHLHEIIGKIVTETRNLRSTVARSAIFALGDFSAKLERSIEPELDIIVQALLHKSIENTAFIRDDIRKAFSTMLEHLTQWRFASSLIHHGANHKNMHVRRMASQFVASLVERMGPTKCLIGAREISAQLIPATVKFAQDGSPHTRYYGRLILTKILYHNAFDRLLRKNLTPNMYRSTIGIIESVKRRGPGEAPPDN